MNPNPPLNWPKTRIESYTGIGCAIRVITPSLEFIVIAQNHDDLHRILGHIGGAALLGEPKTYRCDIRDNDLSSPKMPSQPLP